MKNGNNKTKSNSKMNNANNGGTLEKEFDKLVLESIIDTMIIEAEDSKGMVLINPATRRIEVRDHHGVLNYGNYVIDVTDPELLGKYARLYGLAKRTIVTPSMVCILPAAVGVDKVLFCFHAYNEEVTVKSIIKSGYGQHTASTPSDDVRFSLKNLETALRIIPDDTKSPLYNALRYGIINGGDDQESVRESEKKMDNYLYWQRMAKRMMLVSGAALLATYSISHVFRYFIQDILNHMR